MSYCFQMFLDDAVLPGVFCNRSLCKISALNRVCYWGLETTELGGDFRAFRLVINNSTCLCVFFCLFVCLFVFNDNSSTHIHTMTSCGWQDGDNHADQFRKFIDC